MTAQSEGAPQGGAEQFLFLTISILGGTGNEGKGLAYRWAKAGYRVLIGSRTPPKAEAAAEDTEGKKS